MASNCKGKQKRKKGRRKKEGAGCNRIGVNSFLDGEVFLHMDRVVATGELRIL